MGISNNWIAFPLCWLDTYLLQKGGGRKEWFYRLRARDCGTVCGINSFRCYFLLGLFDQQQTGLDARGPYRVFGVSPGSSFLIMHILWDSSDGSNDWVPVTHVEDPNGADCSAASGVQHLRVITSRYQGVSRVQGTRFLMNVPCDISSTGGLGTPLWYKILTLYLFPREIMIFF